MTGKKKQFTVKTAPVTVDGTDYVLRTNLTMRTIADIQSGDYDRTVRAIREIVVEHPWTDEAGVLLDVADWPDEVAAAVVKAWGALTSNLPPA